MMDPELREIFVVEVRELLERGGEALSLLKRDPSDLAAFDAIFRAVHTLKGSAGLVAFEPMGTLYHAAEDRLAPARGNFAPELADALAEAFELTAGWAEAIARAGEPPASAVLQSQALLPEFSATEILPARAQSAALETPAWARELVAGLSLETALVAVRYEPARDSYFLGEDPLGLAASLPGLADLQVSLREPVIDLDRYDPFATNLRISCVSTAPRREVERALQLVADQIEVAELTSPLAGPDATVSAAIPAAATLRIEAGRLDDLSAALDELVVAKNKLSQVAGQAMSHLDPAQSRALADARATLDRQASALHEALMRLRLAPLAPLFRRFPRLMEDTAQRLGKEVDLGVSSGDVEIDKSVVDGLYEPLLHLLRNGLDHGLESPEEREKLGKPRRGALQLTARADGDQVVIDVADDGRGLDPAKILQTAKDRGLLDEDRAARLSRAETLELIFLPGFSTAGVVTDLSGRGVGLDAVRHAVRALGGSISLNSEVGAGSSVQLRLPVRIRMAKLMTVEAAGEHYAIPVESIVESVRLSPGQITAVRAGHGFIWRDQAVPMVTLASMVGREGTIAPDREARALIVMAKGEPVAIVVDRFHEPVEASIKPLGGLLSRLPGVIGAMLLGDGKILVVLDPAELLQ